MNDTNIVYNLDYRILLKIKQIHVFVEDDRICLWIVMSRMLILRISRKVDIMLAFQIERKSEDGRDRRMNDLEMYREQLAFCDDKIIDALVERNAIIEKIMAYKEEYGMPILQPQQEAKQKMRLEEKLADNHYKEEIYDVFRCILRNSKRIQARRLFDYNIVLIGFMGAGKTTISDYLSTMFAMDIVEMDQIIAEREEMGIPDIFATYGEEYFRNLETNLLIELQSQKNMIISCGGGAAMRERNVEEMKKNGRVVLLTASAQTIYDRVKDSDDRPVLNGRKNVNGISELMEQRREKYEAAADIVVHTDNKTVLQVCEELVQRLCDTV